VLVPSARAQAIASAIDASGKSDASTSRQLSFCGPRTAALSRDVRSARPSTQRIEQPHVGLTTPRADPEQLDPRAGHDRGRHGEVRGSAGVGFDGHLVRLDALRRDAVRAPWLLIDATPNSRIASTVRSRYDALVGSER
jgi:hypothetical protein